MNKSNSILKFRFFQFDSDLPYLALLVFFLSGFLYSFYNKFLPLGEGLFSVYYGLIKADKVPYKDFYLFVPPLHVFMVGWFQDIVGTQFIKLRILGASFLVAESILLFFCFRFHFKRLIAFVATCMSIGLYLSHAPYIMHDYNDVINLILVGFIFSLHWHVYKGGRTSLFLCGLLAGAVMLEKQNLGPLLFIAGLIYIARYLKEKYRGFFYYIAGAAIPLALLVYYLWSQGALVSFVDNIFLNVGQKGRLGEVVTRALTGTMQRRVLVPSALFFVFAYLTRTTWQGSQETDTQTHWKPSDARKQFICAVAIIFAVASSYMLWPYLWPIAKRKGFKTVIRRLPYIVFLSSSGLLAKNFITSDEKNKRIAAFLLPTTIFLFSSVMSAGAYIPLHSSFLSAGYVVGYTAEHMNTVAKRIFLISCSCLLLIIMSYKYYSPYGFGIDARWWGTGLQVPVAQATYPLRTPALKGLYAGKELGYAVDEITTYLIKHRVRNGELLAYPLNSLFYMTTSTLPVNLYSPTFLYDIANSKHLSADLKKIISNPPRYVVWTKYNDLEDLKAHEYMYNKGAPFETHRKLIDIFDTEYTRVLSFKAENDMELQLLEHTQAMKSQPARKAKDT